MPKKNYRSNTTRLYVSKDIYSAAYFARNDVEKFARFVQLNNEWHVWLYPYRYSQHFKTLTQTVNEIDRLYKKYWQNKYGDKK